MEQSGVAREQRIWEQRLGADIMEHQNVPWTYNSVVSFCHLTKKFPQHVLISLDTLAYHHSTQSYIYSILSNTRIFSGTVEVMTRLDSIK